MQGKSAWRMSTGLRRSKLQNPSTRPHYEASKDVRRSSKFDFKCRNFEAQHAFVRVESLGKLLQNVCLTVSPQCFPQSPQRKETKTTWHGSKKRKPWIYHNSSVHHSHNLIYFFMLDCWLDESSRDKVPIPKLKAVHQWIKRWQWSPKGMGSIAWLLAMAEQCSTRHHSTFYPHFTCLYVRYDILLWFLSTLLDWKNTLYSHCHRSACISLLFLQSLDRLCFASMLWVLHVRPNGVMKARWAELPNILGVAHK